MSKFCLDTSAYSAFMRGRPDAVDAIRTALWLGVPTIVLGELRTGFLLGSRRHENERFLAEFVANPVVEVLGVDDDAAMHYAEIVVALRKRNTPIPSNDIWIAAVAAREGARILTCDQHFESIERAAVRVLGQ